MMVTAQNGLVIGVEELEMRNNVIYAADPWSPPVELGRYANLKRTCEVMSELTCMAWNKSGDEYVMPGN